MAKIANPITIIPAILLIHQMLFKRNFFLKIFTTVVSIVHQNAAPRKTPTVRMIMDIKLDSPLTTPKAANAPRKKNMVSGFEKVSKNNEIKSPTSPLPFFLACLRNSRPGLEKNILNPR